MARPLKSQWEFGELFPAEAVRKTLTVSELTGAIRRTLEKNVGTVSVLGEITNLRAQGSGHIYFTLKDANSQIACVLFRTEARTVQREYLTDGQKVVIDGTVTVYEARGQYQLQVFSIQLQGVGALQAAFERLKQKLHAEGLFDQGHKRALPRFPQRIGLVTSPVGAAIKDVLHTVQRRNPSLGIVLAPCRVQGTGAAQEIAAAVHLLNDWVRSGQAPALDLLLLTRGGGSLEDLWAFNEEILARAIYGSAIPVISAVGHEIDFTIADLVADLRAATPTAGAEIITEGVFSSRPFLAEIGDRLRGLLQYSLQTKIEKWRDISRRLVRRHPNRRLREQALRVDDLGSSLNRCARSRFRGKRENWKTLEARLLRLRPSVLVAARQERVRGLAARAQAVLKRRQQDLRDRASRAGERLRLLSPEHVLRRGYSITRVATTGQVLRDARQAAPGAVLRSRLANGEIVSVVERSS